MNWRLPRFIGRLAIICIVLTASVGVGVYLLHHSQNTPNTQWMHLPLGKPGQPTPTIPTNGYLFKDPAGGFITYNLPTNPPATINWTSYRNQHDGYAIDYPSDWIQVTSSSNEQAGMAFYPPGTNLNQEVPGGPKGIGFKWMATPQAVPTDPTIANSKTITIHGVTGQLYTRAALGATITAIFPSKGGSFLLTAAADSDMLIYVFQHMLESLTFT